MTASGTPAIDLVRREGVAHSVHVYRPPERHGRQRDERPEYGAEAAAALGIAPKRVLKTLIATVDGAFVAAVVPVDRQLDPKRLAAACGGRRADLADAATAQRVSGSVIGGISPLALRPGIAVVVDSAALAHPTVHVSAGRRGLQLELAPADLVRLCNAKIAPIVRSARSVGSVVET